MIVAWDEETEDTAVAEPCRGEKPIYRSYLLRFWHSQQRPDWRAYVQDLQSGEYANFANAEEVLHFLLTQLAKDDRHNDAGPIVKANTK